MVEKDFFFPRDENSFINYSYSLNVKSSRKSGLLEKVVHGFYHRSGNFSNLKKMDDGEDDSQKTQDSQG